MLYIFKKDSICAVPIFWHLLGFPSHEHITVEGLPIYLHISSHLSPPLPVKIIYSQMQGMSLNEHRDVYSYHNIV